MKRLKYLAAINPPLPRGGMPKPDDEVSFLPMERIGEEGSLDLSEVRPARDISAGYTAMLDGDLLIAKITPCFENGKGALCKGLHGGIGFGTTELIVLRAKSHTDSGYLYWLTRGHHFRNWGEAEMRGSAGQKRVSEDFVSNYLSADLKPGEQRRIAAYLDDATAKVNRLMKLRERQMELLWEQRAALIHQAVTRGLNPNALLKDSGNPFLPQIPAAWSSTKLKYLGKVTSGFAFDSADFVHAGVRVLKIANIQTMRLDWSDESFVPASFYEQHSAFAVADGDLVFALTRPIISTGLKAAIADTQGERVLLNQRNAVFKPHKCVERAFLYYAVFSRYFVADFESRIDATGQQPNISPISVADIPIALPSLPEQLAIVQFIQRETIGLDRLISAYTRQIGLLTEYRAALIHECVTGHSPCRTRLCATTPTS